MHNQSKGVNSFNFKAACSFFGRAGTLVAGLTCLALPARAQTPAPTPPGIISWWRGETNAVDSAGANNGSTPAGMAYADGEVGQSFSFDGSSRRVSIPDNDSFKLTNSLSIETWVKTAGDGGYILCRSDKRGTPVPWALRLAPGGYLDFHIGSLTDNVDLLAPLASNQWKHVAATLDGASGDVKVYIDGTVAAQANTSLRPLRDLNAASEPTVGIGNSGSATPNVPFTGQIDELALYSRALSAAEVQALYQAGSLGKSQVAPLITAQPTNQTVTVGATVSFSVTADGTPNLCYQWLCNGTNLVGATAATLTLARVQTASAGTYCVRVSNAFGSVLSSDAVLSVVAPTVGAPVPDGLVAWWRGESNAVDVAGGNNGTLNGNATYGPGRVGQGFVFDGSGDGVVVSNLPSLQLQDLTIEAWIKRSSLSTVSYGSGPNGIIFGYGQNGYVFLLNPNGTLNFNKLGQSSYTAGQSITDTDFHHVAVTKSGTTVVFYLDGVASAPVSYATTFAFTTPAGIGFRPDNKDNSFLGTIDEVSIYNRALSSNEIAAIYSADGLGKCQTVAPFIAAQPTSKTVHVGEGAAFTVTAGGEMPVSFQWRKGGTNLLGQTNAVLSLTSVQDLDAGVYSVVVSNTFGSVVSSNAVLTVLAPGVGAPIPDGLVAWWRGESNAVDVAGGNNGTLNGNATYGAGRVGQGFVFDGSGDGVVVSNLPGLQLQDLTIEAWIKRSSLSTVSYGSGPNGIIFSYGLNGYVFLLNPNGTLNFNKLGQSSYAAGQSITDTNFHHVAVTKSGTTVVFYLDGVASAPMSYTTTFTFTTPAGIGFRPDNKDNSFLGSIDEVSIYNRALSSDEIAAIYNADGLGKCQTVPPFISAQPASKTVHAGEGVAFTVTAGGEMPVSFQWRKGGTNLVGQTNAVLSLASVQDSDAGVYSVSVSNAFGSVVSSNAVLTVNPPPVCTPAPDGLVAWWRGETNAVDVIGANNGTLSGNAIYGPGRVGQGFVFDGSGDGVVVSNLPSLQLQDLTIEAWIKRSSLSTVSYGSGPNGIIFSYGLNGYVFLLNPNGTLNFNKLGQSSYTAGQSITDTNFHHVAVTKLGSTVVFYLDGVASAPMSYTTTFTFSTPAGIGFRPDNYDNSFLGTIDEVSIYNRALSSNEIAAIYNADGQGKCQVAPFITVQPANQTVTASSNVTFAVTAGGTPNLSYQWLCNGSNIVGATAATLTLSNVQAVNAGSYCVRVSNGFGSITSSNAVLTVVSLPVGTPAPDGLVAWWRAESNTVDVVSGSSGTLAGSATYGPGRVGKGFVLDGSTDGVLVTNTAALQLQNLTIEAWVKRSSASVMSYDTSSQGNAAILASGASGYMFWFSGVGQLYFNRMGEPAMAIGPAVTDTNFHHVAVTKSGSVVIAYLDGVGYPAKTLSTTFTFTGPVSIGYSAAYQNSGLFGTIDELSVYNRALASNEIAAIYSADGQGKSQVAPFIAVQPATQTVTAGSNVTFAVTAGGTPNLNYQWQRSGTNLPGATAASLTLTNVQAANAGTYCVRVSNGFGAITSSNAVLAVLSAPSAASVPAGIVAWWRGESNALDSVDSNNGTTPFGMVYAPGKVGQCFSFDGSSRRVTIPDNDSFKLTDSLSIEGWINVAADGGFILFRGDNRPGLDPYQLIISRSGYVAFAIESLTNTVSIEAPIDYNVWTHVAATLDGASGSMKLYVDGALATETNTTTRPFRDLDPAYEPAVGIGNHGGTFHNFPFTGQIDELALYSRALSSSEIQALYQAGALGKSQMPPFITAQPTNQTVASGASVTFTVAAGGDPNLCYQWLCNETNIPGATTASLTLANVQAANAGSYCVRVSNGFGAVTSSNAVLAVTGAPVAVPQLIDVAFGAGTTVSPKSGWAATGQATNDFWNFYSRDGANGQYLTFGALTNLKSADGQVTATGLTVANAPGAWPTGSTDPMYQWVVYPFNGGNITVTVTNLAAGCYDFFVYANKCKLGLVVDGVNYGTNSVKTTSGTTPEAWQEGQQYVRFSGVWVASNKVVTITSYPANGENASLAGIQIQGVNPAPVIVGQPQNQAVAAGSSASFSVSASGAAPLNYQWRKAGVNLAGQTNATCVMANVQATDAGLYSVVVSNAFGSAFSSNAVLAVQSPAAVAPLIDVAFGAWTNASPKTGWAAIGQATNDFWNFYTRDGANGQFLTFGALSNLKSVDGQVTGTGLTVANGPGAWSTGSTDPMYQWVLYTFNGGNITLTVTNLASGCYDFLVYGATCNFGLVVDGADYGTKPVNTTSGTTPEVWQEGQQYARFRSVWVGTNQVVTITSYPGSGGATLSGLQVQSVSPVPVIVGQPQNQTLTAGATASFSVSASGATPLSYQWRKAGLNLAGQTNATCLLTNVQATDAGLYSVMVSNAFGVAFSSNAVLALNSAVYDAAASFSLNANPNGPWSYGFSASLGGAMTLYTDKGVDSYSLSYWRSNIDWNVPSVAYNATEAVQGPSNTRYNPHQLSFHPGPGGQFSIVRLTVPQSGSYQVQAAFSGLDTAGTTTDVHILTNGTAVFDGRVTGFGATAATNLVLAFKQGDRLDFVVGDGGNGYFSDTTSIDAKVTPLPAQSVVVSQLIDVAFGAGTTVSPKSGWAATGQATNDFWNFYSRDGANGQYLTFGALTNLKSADGQFTGTGLTVANAPGAWPTGSTDPMYQWVVYPFNGGNITLTVTNLAAGSYDFFVYANKCLLGLVVGGVDYGTRSVKTTSGTTPEVWQEGQQYVRFSGVVVASNQVVTITSYPANGENASVAGLQIQGAQGADPSVPVITSFSPAVAVPGTSVTITGQNFSPTASSNLVYFGAVRAPVTAASATSLTVTVPAGATYAPITVTVNGLTASANTPFGATFTGSGKLDASAFASRFDLGTGDGPAHTAIGDIDGDGKPDLVVGNTYEATVWVFRNIGTNNGLTAASFAAPVKLQVQSGRESVDDLLLADVDGDGRLDIVLANTVNNTVSVFQNLCGPGNISSNTFGARIDLAAGTSPTALAVRDLDGDGKPEIAAANYTSATVSVWRNRSAGGLLSSNSFAPRLDWATTSGTHGVALADIDGDGLPDMVVTTSSSDTTSVFRNLGRTGALDTNSFAARVDFAGGGENVAVGDLDGDGKLDLVTGSWQKMVVSVFRNTATAGTLNSSSLAARVDFAAAGDTHVVALADLNGDGKPEIVLTSEMSSYLSFFQNNSSPGSFTANSLAPRVDLATGWNPCGVAIGDLDGDGRPDILFGNTYDNTVSIYRNILPLGGSADPAVPAIAAFSPTVAVAGANITITGQNFSPSASSNIVYFGAVRAPVVSASATSLTVTVPAGATYAPITVTVNGLTASANTCFTPTFVGAIGTAISAATFGPRVDLLGVKGPVKTIIADMDNDGKPDLVVANGGANTISVFRNIGSNGVLDASSFAAPVIIPALGTASDNPYYLLVADLDGDGKLDIVTPDGNGNRVAVYRNQSTSGILNSNSFAAAVSFPVGGRPIGLAAKDLDGDGRPELIVANYNDGTLSVLRNQSSPGALTASSFAPQAVLPVGAAPFEPVAGDLDGDGKPDLAVFNGNSSTISVYRNIGSGPVGTNSFAARVDLPALSSGNALAMMDVDGDGKLDLLAGSYLNSMMSVYRNLATPGSLTSSSFAARVDFALAGRSHTFAFGDLNGDSHPDVAMATEIGDALSVFQNQATPGTFTSASLGARVDFSAGWNAWGVAIGDLDGDGRPDAVFGNQYDNTLSLYRNVSALAPAPALAALPAGILSWWRAESNTVDSIGSNHGAFVNQASYATGMVGQAFSFDGVSNYVLVTNSPSLNPAGGFSIEAWIYPHQDPTEYATILGKWGDQADLSDQRSYVLQMAAGRVLHFALSDATHQWDTAFQTLESRAGALTLQAWNHVVAAYDQASGTRQLFVNGVKVAERTDAPFTILNTTAPLALGAWTRGGGETKFYFDGLIDEASIYSRALSSNEVQALYLSGNLGKYAGPTEPMILSQPVSQTVLVGTNVNLSVAVGGSPVITYQWRKNGTALAGQTNAVLSLLNVQTNDAGNYSVLVTNTYGSVLSANAVLSVLGQPPFFTAQPRSTNVLLGATVTLRTTASGTAPLSYQWLKDGAALPGMTNSSCTLTNVQATDGGNYSVAVSNPYGSATSSNALLKVLVGGKKVLMSGYYMNSTLQSYLTALGHTSTNVPMPLIGTTNFSNFNAIWLGLNTYATGLTNRTADLLNFVTNGGTLLVEMTTTTALSNYPYAAGLGFTPYAADTVRIINSNSPVNAGLSNSGLSGWSSATHGYFTNADGFNGLTDNGTSNHWVTLEKSVGKGHIVYTSQDISYHIQYGYGATGPNSPKGLFLDNVLRLKAGTTGTNPGPAPMLTSLAPASNANAWRLRFAATSGRTYIVQVSTNLVDWSNLGPAADQGDGSFQFDDPAVTTVPSRFYRLLCP